MMGVTSHRSPRSCPHSGERVYVGLDYLGRGWGVKWESWGHLGHSACHKPSTQTHNFTFLPIPPSPTLAGLTVSPGDALVTGDKETISSDWGCHLLSPLMFSHTALQEAPGHLSLASLSPSHAVFFSPPYSWVCTARCRQQGALLALAGGRSIPGQRSPSPPGARTPHSSLPRTGALSQVGVRVHPGGVSHGQAPVNG